MSTIYRRKDCSHADCIFRDRAHPSESLKHTRVQLSKQEVQYLLQWWLHWILTMQKYIWLSPSQAKQLQIWNTLFDWLTASIHSQILLCYQRHWQTEIDSVSATINWCSQPANPPGNYTHLPPSHSSLSHQYFYWIHIFSHQVVDTDLCLSIPCVSNFLFDLFVGLLVIVLECVFPSHHCFHSPPLYHCTFLPFTLSLPLIPSFAFIASHRTPLNFCPLCRNWNVPKWHQQQLQ